ncbi:hypothetical protein [Streptodolium elevatio]
MRAEHVGEWVRAAGGGDVRLDDHQVGACAEHRGQMEELDVLVAQVDLVVGVEVSGEGGPAEGWEQRVLDGTAGGPGGFRQRREDHGDTHRDPFGGRGFPPKSTAMEADAARRPSGPLPEIRCGLCGEFRQVAARVWSGATVERR